MAKRVIDLDELRRVESSVSVRVGGVDYPVLPLCLDDVATFDPAGKADAETLHRMLKSLFGAENAERMGSLRLNEFRIIVEAAMEASGLSEKNHHPDAERSDPASNGAASVSGASDSDHRGAGVSGLRSAEVDASHG